MLRRVVVVVAMLLSVFSLILGCATAPSSIQELGTEDGEMPVAGSHMYVGWYGLAFNSKPDVYQFALRRALDQAEVAGRGDALREVKVWATQYTGPHILLAMVPAILTVSIHDTSIYDLVLWLTSLALSGLEVADYTVTGVPYFK